MASIALEQALLLQAALQSQRQRVLLVLLTELSLHLPKAL